jgi:Na+-exporting ATPase
MSRELERHPFLLSVKEVEDAFGTDRDRGLTTAQVVALSAEYGRNELDVGCAIPWYTIFIRQLCNAMILVCRPRPGNLLACGC